MKPIATSCRSLRLSQDEISVLQLVVSVPNGAFAVTSNEVKSMDDSRATKCAILMNGIIVLDPRGHHEVRRASV